MDLYNASMVERLGNAIGRFEEYDIGGRGFRWKESLCFGLLWISQDLSKVNLDDPIGSCWTPIRYEKLLELCAFCGIIGHTSKDCSTFYLADGSPSQKHQYGSWMQFSERSSMMYRSQCSSLLRKNKMVADLSMVDLSTPQDGKNLQIGVTGTGSPLPNFDRGQWTYCRHHWKQLQSLSWNVRRD